MVSRISPTQMPVRQLRTNERSTTRPYRMSLRAKRAAAYLGDGGYRAAHRKSGDQVISDNYFFRKVLIDVQTIRSVARRTAYDTTLRRQQSIIERTVTENNLVPSETGRVVGGIFGLELGVPEGLH